MNEIVKLELLCMIWGILGGKEKKKKIGREMKN